MTETAEPLHVPDPSEPDVDELQADEMYGALVTPVRVEGPVSTHELPARGGSARSWSITGDAQRVLGEDLRRKKALLLSFDHPLFFGYTIGECQASTAARWPALQQLALSSIDELWIRSAEAAGAKTEVTVAEEYWAH